MNPRNPYPTVDVIVEVPGGIVLIERANEPRGWALPGGFVDYGEPTEAAACREVMEETGLTVELTDLLGVYSAPDRDPRQHNLSVVYVGRAHGAPVGGDDASRAAVFSVGALPEPLCFDHARIIADYAWWKETAERPAPAPGIQPAVLLAAARDAIEAAVNRRPPNPSMLERAPFARAPGAVFVTLRNPDRSLRGCIGELVAQRTLIDSVRGCAAGSALRDPRFPPVEREEIEGLHIGISVLTPSRPSDPARVEVGRHGVIVERGERRGVLLPEVAVDQGWTREELLAGVCRKAGLPLDAWRDAETTIRVFETRKYE